MARRYGIDRRVLFRWKEALRPRQPEGEAPGAVFAPVQIMDAAPPAVSSTLGVEIELAGGRRLRFERDTDSETMRRLVALLEGSGQ